jgi:hypothetical protein
MGMARSTLELLESLLTEREMTPDELDAQLADYHPEDLYLDFKDGRELNEKKKASATLRQYMSGFANSEGGVLIIGANEGEGTVTGCPAPGGGDLATWGGDLAAWASDCVAPIASLFSMRPDFYVIDHPNGKVLVAWTARSLNLVPCNEAGAWVYYFRLHDKILPAPEYLIRDLMLGRRQHPSLRLTHCQLDSIRVLQVDGEAVLQFGPRITIENEGLSCAEGVIWGIIGWDREPRGPMSGYLRSSIEVREPDVSGYSGDCFLYHAVSAERPGASMEPFRIETLGLRWESIIPISLHQTRYIPYEWQAAVYILPKGSPPAWYQLTLLVTENLLQHIPSNHVLSSDSEFLDIERMPGKRPVVAWHSIAD